jgi:hypothetical protein
MINGKTEPAKAVISRLACELDRDVSNLQELAEVIEHFE